MFYDPIRETTLEIIVCLLYSTAVIKILPENKNRDV